MSQLSEAEVAGDDVEVRRLLAVLRDRHAIPAKVLVFHEDARPGYFGTFTRSSHDIGPRTPFARDAVQVDYGYDSGEEWAEEDAGEADDVVDDAEEEGGGDDDEDSDLDSWLVDDDEVEEPGTPIEERMSSPGFPELDFPPPGSNSGKRKAKEEKAKDGSGGGKKRRVVVPLVQFAKGPEWETTIGQCTYDPFKVYRIQLFNGACPAFAFIWRSGCSVLVTKRKRRYAVPDRSVQVRRGANGKTSTACRSCLRTEPPDCGRVRRPRSAPAHSQIVLEPKPYPVFVVEFRCGSGACPEACGPRSQERVP